MAQRFNISPTADGTPFDNDTNGFAADNVQDAIEEARDNSVGKLMDFIFHAAGNTSNKWLGVGNGSTASNTLPLIIPQEGQIVWSTFSNQDNDVDIDVEFYINNTLEVTWEVRNKRTAWKTDFSTMTINQGDRLSCFLRKYDSGTGDSTAQDPVVAIFIRITGDSDGEGGTVNGT